MDNKIKDRRYRRTQKQLINALIELLKIKHINHISVRELSELADINRATFYLHYKSPYDLLMSLEDRLFDIIYTPYQNHDIMNPDNFLLSLYNAISDNFEIIQVFNNPNSGNTFWDRLSKSIKAQFNTLWSSHLKYLSKQEIEYYSSFIIDGYISVIKCWISNEMREKPEQMVELTKLFQYKILPKA